MKSKETSKNLPIGRPTKLTPVLVNQARDVMAKGLSQNAAIKALGISRDTFYRWKREDKEFAAAITDGKTYGEAQQEEVILAMGLGQIKGSVPAMQMYMRNVYGWDKNQDSTVNQTINVGQMNVLQEKSSEELLDYIKDVTHEVKDIIDVEVEE